MSFRIMHTLGGYVILALAITLLDFGPAEASEISRETNASAEQSPSSSAPHQQLINRFCITCHNERLQSGDLSLAGIDLANVGQHSEILETVVMKLRAGAMPPVGRPRPDPATLSGFIKWLEDSLDRAALEQPNPGRTASFHRLNRTEYKNAIRDILGLDVDTSELLPADDAAFGFDNIGEMLTVSPVLLERYLSAANKVSRLAVGDTSSALGSAFYSVSQLHTQDDQMSEHLPFGSRGGAAVQHYFPADGEYVFTLLFGGSPRLAADVRINGERVAEIAHPGGSPVGPPRYSEIRLPVKAGSHTVGISFPGDRLKSESRYPQHFPWGNSATFPTNTGSVVSLKLQSLDINGPFNVQGLGETPSRRRIFVCRPQQTDHEENCAENILSRLTRRAYRRPVSATDLKPLLEVFRHARTERTFDGSIQMALERLLVDPEFLFRIETDPEELAPGEPYRVSNLALASRLSFFLWSSVPDEELLKVAEDGHLNDPLVLETQVLRMLKDPRAQSLITNFAAQWLYLRNVDQANPDSYLFPEWDDDLRRAFVSETELFLEDQINADHSVIELLTAPYTFVNERLATHYDLPNVYGSHFRKVKLPDAIHRGGLLGHGSILLVTSYPNRTSPVLRGKWLLENFLNFEPPTPPPDVPGFPEIQRGEHQRSVRERLEEHRKNPVCASCHSVIDPLGFALEHYNAIGQFRETEEDGRPVDASASMPDGVAFDGLAGMRTVMLDRKNDFVNTVVNRLLTYALGRGVEHYDQPVIRQIMKDAEGEDYRWSSLIVGITQSTPFQMKRRFGAE